jgi:hypothetical protein
MEDLQEFLTMCGEDEPTFLMCCLFMSSKHGQAATHEKCAILWGQVQYRMGQESMMETPSDIKLQEAYNDGYRAAQNKAIEIITKGL